MASAPEKLPERADRLHADEQGNARDTDDEAERLASRDGLGAIERRGEDRHPQRRRGDQHRGEAGGDLALAEGDEKERRADGQRPEQQRLAGRRRMSDSFARASPACARMIA